MTPGRLGFFVSAIIHIAVLLPLVSGVMSSGMETGPEQEKALTVDLELEFFSSDPEPDVVTVQALSPKITKQEIITETIEENSVMPVEKQAPPMESIQVSKPAIKKSQLVAVDKQDSLVSENDASYIRLLEQQYTTALKQAIEARKYYPSRARRQAREGNVIVGFRINRQGGIKDIRIVSSSSVRLLDKAAINAVNSVGKFKPIPEHINREWWKFEISLSYYLL